jgi:hypothetical protein
MNGSVVTETSDANLFDGQAGFLGAYSYPNVFSGEQVNLDNSVRIYAVTSAPTAASFFAAVAALAPSDVTYTIVGVPRSWAQMEQLTQEMAQDTNLLQQGVYIQQVGPEPSSGEVSVTLQTPTPTALELLAESLGVSAVAPSDYVAAATGILDDDFGAGNLDIQPTTSQPAIEALNRVTDVSPFYGGDKIETATVGCTGGFGVTGNVSGKDFELSAGHCGSGTWKIGGTSTVMGKTSSVYFTWGGNDFQTIAADGSPGVAAYVWTGGVLSTTTAPVIGQTLPLGGKFTFDGSVTGEVRNANFIQGGICEDFTNDQGQLQDTCNLIVGSVGGGVTVCQGGDSGGPAYQYNSSGQVYAVGTIVGYGNNGQTCYAEQIENELAASSTTLMTT